MAITAGDQHGEVFHGQKGKGRVNSKVFVSISFHRIVNSGAHTHTLSLSKHILSHAFAALTESSLLETKERCHILFEVLNAY